MLPKDAVPEKTSGREGFNHLDDFHGNTEKCTMHFMLRNHDAKKLEEQKKSCDSPLNIPASRFFRPYNKRLSLLEPLKVLRIKNEIKYAARHGEVYHLWWHPHNFGANIEQNLKELETVLKCYQYCSGQYGMQSFSMKELKDYIQYDKD